MPRSFLVKKTDKGKDRHADKYSAVGSPVRTSPLPASHESPEAREIPSPKELEKVADHKPYRETYRQTEEAREPRHKDEGFGELKEPQTRDDTQVDDHREEPRVIVETREYVPSPGSPATDEGYSESPTHDAYIRPYQHSPAQHYPDRALSPTSRSSGSPVRSPRSRSPGHSHERSRSPYRKPQDYPRHAYGRDYREYKDGYRHDTYREDLQRGLYREGFYGRYEEGYQDPRMESPARSRSPLDLTMRSSEPMASAVAPFTPAVPNLAARLSNGKHS